MKLSMVLGIALALCLSTVACGDDSAAATPAAPSAEAQAAAAQQAAAAAAQAAAQAAAAPAAPTVATGSNFGTITLAAGFTPDPHVVEGSSGAGAQGGRDASTLGAGCLGTIDAAQPDHLLVTTSVMGNLRIMTKSDTDTTLVIQKPDGTYACNDDGPEGLNPVAVIANAPVGTYQIWVGSYSADQQGQYKLGISEIPSVTPNSL